MTRSLITLEHSRLAQALDFAAMASAAAVFGLATVLTAAGAPVAATLLLTLAGLLAWTLLEYLLHRFLLHSVQPFRRWHALHHQRPRARIYAPTWLTASLVVGGVLAPLWWLAGVHAACALTFGLVLGNLGYALAHCVAHQSVSSASGAFTRAVGLDRWRTRVRARHLLHHGRLYARAHYGVSTGLWDHVFDTARPRSMAPQQAVGTQAFDSAQTADAIRPTKRFPFVLLAQAAPMTAHPNRYPHRSSTAPAAGAQLRCHAGVDGPGAR